MAQNSKGAYLNVLQDADGKDVYPITRADGVYMNDGTTAQAKCKALDSKIDSTKSTLEQNFQAGVDGIYNAITAQGTTPASKSQGDVKNAIKTLADAKYAAGNSAGVASVTVSASASGRTVTAKASNGKTTSASVALAGSNGTVSVSTAGGSGNQSFDITDGWCTSVNVDRTGAYNQGVKDADNRVNSSSANYKGGYNAGYSAGLAAGRAEKKTIVIQLTGDKTAYGDLPGGTINLQSNVDWTVSSEGNGIGLGNSRGTVYAQVNKGQSRSSSGPVWINMGAWGTLTIKA